GPGTRRQRTLDQLRRRVGCRNWLAATADRVEATLGAIAEKNSLAGRTADITGPETLHGLEQRKAVLSREHCVGDAEPRRARHARHDLARDGNRTRNLRPGALSSSRYGPHGDQLQRPGLGRARCPECGDESSQGFWTVQRKFR